MTIAVKLTASRIGYQKKCPARKRRAERNPVQTATAERKDRQTAQRHRLLSKAEEHRNHDRKQGERPENDEQADPSGVGLAVTQSDVGDDAESNRE